MNDDFAPYLRPTFTIDADHPEVIACAERLCADASDHPEAARRLFLFVRDEVRYNPYPGSLALESFKASATLKARVGFCVPKAILMTALVRARGIPARLGYADVKNHLASQRLVDLMRTDVFAFHGYTELFLGGRWIKATPTFDTPLCARFGVRPLEFDGEHDAMFQEFDHSGRRYMNYLRDHGSFADFPLEKMLASWAEHYPHFAEDPATRPVGDLRREVAEERNER